MSSILEFPEQYQAELEIRIFKRLRKLTGKFFFNRVATVSNRGKKRKETFKPTAFDHSVDRILLAQQDLTRKQKRKARKEIIQAAEDEVKNADIHILVGHDFNKPLGSVAKGTAKVKKTEEALEFEVDLPPIDAMPSYMRDLVDQISGDLVDGISPGFHLPPSNINPNAEKFVPEPKIPGVKPSSAEILLREIHDVILKELSIVTVPAYVGNELHLRQDQDTGLYVPTNRRRIWL